MNRKQAFPLFHVPHDGAEFPKELMASVCVPEESFLYYHERMRDTGVFEMIPHEWRNRENTVFFPISRLLCDVERFLGPEEPMEKLGMGFCYERVFDGTRIKNISDELLRETLSYYHRHHDWLNQACAKHSRLLLLDMHSFSDSIVPLGQLRDGEKTPDVCLGIDEEYTPPVLIAVVEDVFREAGFTTARNYPYSGCLVPNAILGKTTHCECASIMLEWNKRAYCDEHGIPAAESIERIRNTIKRFVEILLDLI